MVSKGGRGTRSEEATPTSYPETTPPQYNQPGHDFTLQAVMEMQKSIGKLDTKVDRLIEDVKCQGEALDSVKTRLAWFTGGIAGVAGFLALIAFLLQLLPWDKIIQVMMAKP